MRQYRVLCVVFVVTTVAFCASAATAFYWREVAKASEARMVQQEELMSSLALKCQVCLDRTDDCNKNNPFRQVKW